MKRYIKSSIPVYGAKTIVDIDSLKEAILYLFEYVCKEKGLRAGRLKPTRIKLIRQYDTRYDAYVDYNFLGYKNSINIAKLPINTPIAKDTFIQLGYPKVLMENCILPSEFQEMVQSGLSEFKQQLEDIESYIKFEVGFLLDDIVNDFTDVNYADISNIDITFYAKPTEESIAEHLSPEFKFRYIDDEPVDGNLEGVSYDIVDNTTGLHSSEFDEGYFDLITSNSISYKELSDSYDFELAYCVSDIESEIHNNVEELVKHGTFNRKLTEVLNQLQKKPISGISEYEFSLGNCRTAVDFWYLFSRDAFDPNKFDDNTIEEINLYRRYIEIDVNFFFTKTPRQIINYIKKQINEEINRLDETLNTNNDEEEEEEEEIFNPGVIYEDLDDIEEDM